MSQCLSVQQKRSRNKATVSLYKFSLLVSIHFVEYFLENLFKHEDNFSLMMNSSIFTMKRNLMLITVGWLQGGCSITLTIIGSRDGTVVRALASQQCGLGSTPVPGVICELSLLLVLVLAPRGFAPGTQVFPLLKNQHIQIPIRSWRCPQVHVAFCAKYR